MQDFKFNAADYDSFINYLNKISEPEYKSFSEKLTNGKYSMLGVRVPLLRAVAKEIYKTDYKCYLNACRFMYYEDTIIFGFVVAQIKDYSEFIRYLPEYIDKIDSWSLCDSVAMSPKTVKKNKNEFLEFLKPYIDSDKEFYVRFALICLLSCYIDKQNLDFIFEVCEEKDKLDHYYVKMGIAWLISTVFIKFPDETKEFLKNDCLSYFTHNKSIQKTIESYRVSDSDKIFIRGLKRIK